MMCLCCYIANRCSNIMKVYFSVILFSISYAFETDSLLAKFVQSDYEVKDIKVDVESYNKDLVSIYRCVNFKPNRTTTVFNFTTKYKIDLGNKIEVIVQSYKFASNEYRNFPMDFQVDFCKSMNANILGLASSLKCGNITKCYFYKDVTYKFCNFVLDYTRLPPYIPTGLYKVKITMAYQKIKIGIVNGYGEIYRQIKNLKRNKK